MKGCDSGRLKSYFKCLQLGTPTPFNFGFLNLRSGTLITEFAYNIYNFKLFGNPESHNLGGRKLSNMLIFHCTLYL